MGVADMTTLAASKTRIPPTIFNSVVYRGERVRVQHRNGQCVVLVSDNDLAVLEAIEDYIDITEASKALKEIEEGKATAVPWEEIKRRLGL